ncbi:TetR/AcrR family transcriptional regulator [Sinimarinibacterium sp. CAU 1509]|nr:TetR/AcrR family transcriptional regulator [Sinimarinibacterium sp. CAU 1509]
MIKAKTNPKRLSAAQRRIHDAALRLFAAKGSTDISVSELAAAAGVARGTIYNNLESPERLFRQVAAQLAEDMDERVAASYVGIDDPAERIAIGMRLYIRRAHEEPHWARFLLNFSYTNDALRKLWGGPPMRDLMQGVESGRFTIQSDQLLSGLGAITGMTLSAIMGVVDGLRTWRDAGADAAELTLRALGVAADDARQIATRELPALADAHAGT